MASLGQQIELDRYMHTLSCNPAMAEFLKLETAFTLIQFAVVSPLIALAWRDRA